MLPTRYVHNSVIALVKLTPIVHNSVVEKLQHRRTLTERLDRFQLSLSPPFYHLFFRVDLG